MRAENVSALICTYGREKAEHLESALESLYSQTCVPGEIVIVVDGPIGADQEAVIERYSDDCRIKRTKIVKLEHSSGLAASLNAGLQKTLGEYIMRMDSDDICDLDRLKVQMEYAEAHPRIDLIGSWALEFKIPGCPLFIKACPTHHEDIVRALRWRNSLVHPSVLIRRSALAAVGDYCTTVGKLEDYDLFVRLILNGSRFHIIPRTLLYMRISIDQRRRRGGLHYLMDDIKFRSNMFRMGFLSRFEFLASVGGYTLFRLVPIFVRNQLYSLVRTSPDMSAAGLVVAQPDRME